MVVEIDLSRNPPRVGESHALFKTNFPTRSGAGSDYVPSNDGQQFLVTIPAGASTAPSIIATTNWTELLER